MASTEPQRTAALAGAPNYLDDGDAGPGRPVPNPPVPAGEEKSLRRADLRDFLAAVLRVFVEDDGVGKLYAAPVPITLGPLSDLAPDIIFITSEKLEDFAGGRLDDSVDLVIRLMDRGGWSRAAQQLEAAGVGEYWLITLDGSDGMLRARGDGGAYGALTVEDSGIFRSTVIPLLWLRREWLSADPLPLIRSVLIEWGLPRLFAD